MRYNEHIAFEQTALALKLKEFYSSESSMLWQPNKRLAINIPAIFVQTASSDLYNFSRLQRVLPHGQRRCFHVMSAVGIVHCDKRLKEENEKIPMKAACHTIQIIEADGAHFERLISDNLSVPGK
jgi:hypothetical protein